MTEDTTKKEENKKANKDSPLPPAETEKKIKETAPNFLAPDINAKTSPSNSAGLAESRQAGRQDTPLCRDVALQRLSAETEPEDISTIIKDEKTGESAPEPLAEEAKVIETEVKTEKEVIVDKEVEIKEQHSEDTVETRPGASQALEKIPEPLVTPPISDPLLPVQSARPERSRGEVKGGEGKKEPIITTPTPAPAMVRPVLSFLDKLKELRGQANKKRAENKQKNLEKILKYAREHNRITNDEVEEITKVRDDRATEYLNILVKQGKIIRFGKTKNTFYKPVIN